jgi:hypothetical protein
MGNFALFCRRELSINGPEPHRAIHQVNRAHLACPQDDPERIH